MGQNPARFIRSTFADSSSFSLKFRICSAATAVSIIMLDDRPDRSLSILVKVVLLLQFSSPEEESGGLSRDEIVTENTHHKIVGKNFYV